MVKSFGSTMKASRSTAIVVIAVTLVSLHDSHVAKGLTLSVTRQHQRHFRSITAQRRIVPRDSGMALYMVNPESDNEASASATTNDPVNATDTVNGIKLPRSIVLGKEEDEIDDDDDEKGKKEDIPSSPQPPNESPKKALLIQEYENLQEQSDKTAFVIEELSARAKDLQRQLREKQKELDENRDKWGFEKSSFLSKIAELAGVLEQNRVIDEEEQYRKQKLESEVELLQTQIVQVQMALKREQKTSEELRNRLNDVEDAMEFEQMSFEKERLELQKQLKAEKDRLQNIQAQWDADKDRFESERKLVQEQLDEERERLKKAQMKWAENQFEYEEQQELLKSLLEEQKEKLAETEAMIESERIEFGEERSALKSVIQADRLKLQDIEQALEEERASFRAAQADLEQKILDEQDKVDALYARLQEEQERFYLERDNLEVSLELERKRVQRVQEDLDREREDFESEKAKLQEEIDEQVRINRLKKKQMASRYKEIRSQLTNLWEGAKRDAREEKKKLTAKYEGKLSNMSVKVTELESSLLNAQRASEELNLVLSDLRVQKDRATEETQMVEARYITMISQRNREIAELKIGMNELKDKVREREAQLEKYESSFRELLKLGVKVTGNKIKKGRSRLSGWIRRDRNN